MTSNDRSEDIEGEAAEWLVLQTAGQFHLADELVFERWLERSPQHRAAYERLRETWNDLAILQQQPGNLLRHTADLHDRARTAPPRHRWLGPTMALAACLVLVIGLAAAWFGNPVTALIADHSSLPGEVRSVLLPDGSRVDLGPSSAIRLHFSAAERRIELLGGSAYFDAVPQAVSGGRPFIVDTGALSARALGTQFMVERLPQRDGVAVAEHTVAVTMTGAAEERPTILSPGQSLRLRRGSTIADMVTTNPQEIAAWRSGNLVFYQVALQEVVAELNRYRRGRIVIADDALSSRVVSGVFRAGDSDGALRVMAQELRLQVVVLPFFTIIYN